MHINNDFQRNSNISHVLETIWYNGSISRIDISEKLGLYRSTVSNIVNTLIEGKIIIEGESGSATEKGGRKPVYLSINKHFGCIVGIELQPDFYNVSAITFNREEIYTDTGNSFIENNDTKANSVTKDANPEDFFETTLDSLLKKILPEIKSKGIPILGICLGIPGIINTDEGVILRSDPFNLKDYDYGKKLGTKYNIPLLIENDAKCCAWLQKAINPDVSKKDFLCVLARNHKDAEGIGVGLSILMNGRIVNGHNFGAGEYISQSWRENKKGQTGLPQAVISTATSVDDSYKEFIKDLFQTLTPTVPLLEPNLIFLHGQEQQRKDLIMNTIHNDVTQFESVCNRCGSTLIIMDKNPFEIAQGAAYMFIQKLFEIPSLEKEKQYSNLSWSDINFQL